MSGNDSTIGSHAAAGDRDRPKTAPASGSPAHGRIETIDFARGLAVCLMILSHGVNGLLEFDDFTDWGMVPLHAITKFSSSLFIMVFGIALAVAFVPKTGAPDWPRRRNRLLWRGLVVLFWYKVLTVVEMYAQHDREAILDTLRYRNFPSYAEILGFYAIALLWIPWLLPLWARTPALLRWASPALLALASWWLLENFDFRGVPQLQAILVEHPDYYTWGQFSRGPLVLLGLLIGGLLLRCHDRTHARMALAGALALISAALLIAFVSLAGDSLDDRLQGIARNAGKHPPELMFMLFSLGGASALLALAVAGGDWLARVLRPVTLIGSDALMAFVFHIAVIFILFRDMLGYLHTVSYQFALTLSLGLILATSAWIWLLQRVQRRS
ncbi:heparan-alpha-glucosaminide N-acetyltransferase domain-containing protein [Marilutibacter alkalisoli]|uniref:heparan-alpha-glucosaminide N-acetyltransferase domain-containing protein n=1 Tax=Marilutibacter alkalisoli TaxID=2591633 RepID=UPI001FCA3A6E|nr:OpgC domain-containing protein [Lysobacter alkalisoli]